MRRWFPTLCVLFALSGCINTPNTKALVTPVGGAGYHTFKPTSPPNRIDPSNVDRLAAAAAEESRRNDQGAR
jgi:hypothetical protein